MTIGASIALIVIGAILAFAVQLDLQGLNLDAIGIILILGGIVGLIFGLFFGPRRVVRREPGLVEERVEERRDL